MNTCNTCRHWRQDYPLSGLCKRIGIVEPLKPRFSTSAFITHSTNRPSTEQFKTGPNFGCVLHQELSK